MNTKTPDNSQISPVWQIISNFYQTYDFTNGLDIEIQSQIPKGVGLGSSAAVAVATAAALNNLFELDLSPNQISNHALEAEKITHAHPSGIDNTISTFGGALLYKDGKINRIEIPFDIPLLLINSGVSHETKTQVTHVRNLYKSHPSIFGPVFQAIDAISLKVENALRVKKLDILGDLINYNQHLLRLLGVSTKELEALIDFAKLNGSIGAKLTGAGGGGCILALFNTQSTKNNCVEQLNSMKVPYYNTKICDTGIRILSTSK